MFYAKSHDDDEDELPGLDADDEEGLEQPLDLIEETEEIVIEEEPGEEEESELPAAPAPRKSTPAKKGKKAKARPKKKVKKAKKKPVKKAKAKTKGKKKKKR